MKRKRSASSNLARLCAWICGAGLILAGLSPASAEEQNLKGDAKRAGRTAGSVTREIGQGAKTAGKEIGHGFKNIGTTIGDAAKEGGREFRRAVTGESR
jgi:hypothetical protein